MDDLINKWEIMRALQAINPVAKLMDGDLVIKISEVENVLENMPSVKPDVPDINVGSIDTTTHDSIPAETGKNDEDRTSGDCISRQQAIDALRKMQTYKLFAGDDMLLIDQAEAQTELMMLPSVQPERKTGRWITDDSELGIKCNKCGKSFSDYVNAGTEYVFLMETPKFCPNCEADMRGGENDGCSQVFEREESDV